MSDVVIPDLNSPNEPPAPVAPPLPLILFGALALIAAGAIAGFLLTRKSPGSPGAMGAQTTPAMLNTATEVGSTDTKTFRDQATGTLESGGLNGEGTHRLVRDGGPSQTVYLISSVVDLETFIGKKVQVWGETIRGQKAAWLMDVGRVKLIE